MYTHVYIYIYIERERGRERFVSSCSFILCYYFVFFVIRCYACLALRDEGATVNLPKALDFRGFDSSRISNFRGGILLSTGNFPEMLSQASLAGIILVGRLGVAGPLSDSSPKRRGSRWETQKAPTPRRL